MGNRKLPFGYKIRFGDIVIEPEESQCVRMLFVEYLKGNSYQELAERMKEDGVPYDEGKPWNKNMVARILGDERYIGAAIYPAIIDRQQYDAVTAMRTSKKIDIDRSDSQKVLRKICNARVTPHVERQVLHMLNALIKHPELIRIPEAYAQTQSDLPILRKRLDEALACQPIDEDAAMELIRKIASAEYTAISSAEYETRKIQWLLRNAECADELEETLLQKCVRSVQVSPQRKASLMLKNGQIIEGSTLP